MSDEPPPGPQRVPVTAVWLAEQRGKQAAYAERRRRYVERLTRQEQGQEDDEADASTTPAVLTGSPKGRRRGRIIDPRQLKFEV